MERSLLYTLEAGEPRMRAHSASRATRMFCGGEKVKQRQLVNNCI